MYATANLSRRLQSRVTGLSAAQGASFPAQFCHLVTWFSETSLIARLLETLPTPEKDAAVWLSEHNCYGGRLELPRDEAQAVAVCWMVLRHVTSQDDPAEAMWQIGVNLAPSGSGAFTLRREFASAFLNPVLDWINDRILKEEFLLHSLVRYSREVGWFRRDDLRDLYESDTARGEKTLDDDLRHHLLRDGIDYPYSQAHTPSGRPDVVIHDEMPIPLEVKVFDPSLRKDRDGIRAGFVQAIEYASDYGRPDGYLAVFDASAEGLTVQGDDAKMYPPSVVSGGVTIFVVTIPIAAPQAASSRKSAKRMIVDPAYLRRRAGSRSLPRARAAARSRSSGRGA